MDLSNCAPIISICIPTYNGLPFLTELVEELLRSPRADFEIVVSDDCSNDDTWAYTLGKSKIDSRIRCFRNPENFGMDRNFAQSVSMANGRFVWLCGQDDKIFHEGIDAVVDLIQVDPELDFIYLNHVKVQEGESTVSLIPECSSDHVYGRGLEEFLRYHCYELPTFLPKFIIKKSAWDSVDIARYFDTSYCQVGVFLETSKHMRWCHLGGVYVIGLTPADGWQAKPLAYAKISLGLYLMIYRTAGRCSWITHRILAELYRKYFKRALYSLILLRALNLKIDPMVVHEFFQVVRPFPIIRVPLATINSLPRPVNAFLLQLIRIRRSVRESLK